MKAIILASLLATPAMAAENCAPRDRVLEHLSGAFGESRQSFGVAGGERVVETFANVDTGTWTLLVTTNSGLTCIIGAGENFQRVDDDPAPMGEPM